MAAVIVFSSTSPSAAEPTVASSTADVEQRPGKEGKWSWVCWVATLSHLGDRNYPSVSLQACIPWRHTIQFGDSGCIHVVYLWRGSATIRSLNFQGHQSTFRAQIIRSSSIFGDLHLTCGIVLQTWTNHFLFFLLLRLLSQKKIAELWQSYDCLPQTQPQGELFQTGNPSWNPNGEQL